MKMSAGIKETIIKDVLPNLKYLLRFKKIEGNLNILIESLNYVFLKCHQHSAFKYKSIDNRYHQCHHKVLLKSIIVRMCIQKNSARKILFYIIILITKIISLVINKNKINLKS